jgi:hypothetical protein
MRSKHHHLDEDSASRLLQGHVHPDDAPPGYSALAGLLNSAAQVPLGPVDEDAAAVTVSAMVEVIRDATPAPETSRRKTMLGKLLAGKALAAAAVAVIGLTATGAAAGTGSLPDQAQDVVSEAVSHVGIDIPRGKSADHRKDGDHRKDKTGDDEAPADDTAGDDTTGEEPKGMSGVVKGIKSARTAESGPMGQEVCAIASDGKCHSGDEHKGQGGDDEAPDTDGQNNGSGDEKNGDTGKPEDTPAKPDTPAGSIDTGADNSERDLPSGGRPE